MTAATFVRLLRQPRNPITLKIATTSSGRATIPVSTAPEGSAYLARLQTSSAFPPDEVRAMLNFNLSPASEMI